MNRVLCFGASNSNRSINVQLARHAAARMSNIEIDALDLNEFEMPIFGVDREREHGIPKAAYEFKERIARVDGVLLSLAEHNGSYTVAFKNVMDWASRTEGSVWQDKPMCVLATSPGGRGARGVLDAALDRFPRLGGHVIASFSLPHFDDNFDQARGITDPELDQQLAGALDAFGARLGR